jgi:hypothetical protein
VQLGVLKFYATAAPERTLSVISSPLLLISERHGSFAAFPLTAASEGKAKNFVSILVVRIIVGVPHSH